MINAVAGVREVQSCVVTLVEADVAVPSWEELADGVRPPPSHGAEEPSQSKHGWQKVAGHFLDDRKLQVVTPTFSITSRTVGSGALCVFPLKQVDAIRSTCFPHLVVAETSPPFP